MQARTGALVNVRGALSPEDSKAAQENTGKVEAKLVEHKVSQQASCCKRAALLLRYCVPCLPTRKLQP